MRLALIDPLSLVGKEISKRLSTWPGLTRASVDCFHTKADDEHQIAELGGEAALVPPLDDPMVLAHYDAVITGSREATPRLHGLAAALQELPPDLPLVDAGRAPALRANTRIVSPARDIVQPPLQFRVPDPSVVAALHVLEAVAELKPLAVGIHSEEPVSVLGPGAVEALARQAIVRLQGEPAPAEELPGVLAFNFRSLPDDGVAAEAEALLSPVETSVTRAAVGRFHGHVVHLTILFSEVVSSDAFEELCRASESLQLPPDGLDVSQLPDSGAILVGAPAVSSGGHLLAVTTALDGLLFGGARSALELLASLV